jgi:hypothetical protein
MRNEIVDRIQGRGGGSMQRWVGFLVLLGMVVGVSRPAAAQGRLSDKDLQRFMQNLKDESQPFRQTFANALKMSNIRKTGKEKDARMLVDSFAKQANSALEGFKRNQKAEPAVTELVHTAAQIDPLVYSLQLDSATTSQWERMRGELHQIAQAYGISEPYFAPQSAAAVSTKGTCLNAVGIERSRQLVNECLQVSPATHPPCNAQNACSMIVDEIKRGCGLIGQGAPGFCAEYK